ncbi:MAG: hypothetical protein NWF06_08010 [Candidatus Bathyarchaeota archaeon]|nr:hypothetical protein [Candidatus Bathyarchaeum sp.]
MNHKKLMTILTTTAIITTLLGTMLLTQISMAATTYTSDYVTTDGVMYDDSYVLFPFEMNNLTIGFSKYGEMIDYNTKIGLSYDGYDAFGPDAGVVESQWVEGWILNITYVEGGNYKNIWAMATYSDYYAGGIGGDWNEDVTVGSLSLDVRGGRKTSGGAVTDPITMLYDGPREFIALLKTTIYEDSTHTTPLVSLTFTIVFNKVEKQVVIYKDVKRIDEGKNIGDMQIEFGDRGEWDLGSSASGAAPKSYAHFFTNQTTIYDGEYQLWYENATAGGTYDSTYTVCQIISDDQNYVGWAAFWPTPIVNWVGATQLGANRATILTTTSTKTETHVLTETTSELTITGEPSVYPQNTTTGDVLWKEDPMVFVNDAYKIIDGTDPESSVTYNNATNTITFPSGYEPGAGAVVTIVYKHENIKEDMNSEPNSPFVIGEWAFRMTQAGESFRGVTIYGITDLNDGDDEDIGGGHTNVIDSEIQYYLDETFDPYDLQDAVHKDTRRWVYIDESLSSSQSVFVLENAPMEFSPLPDWDAYSDFSERVLVDGVLQVPTRAGGTDYTLSVNTATGVGTITFASAVAAGSHVKILYSTLPEWSDSDSITFDDITDTTNTIDVGTTLTNNVADAEYVPVDPLGVNMSFNFDLDVEVEITGTANFTETIVVDWYDWIEDFKVLSDPNEIDDDVDHYTATLENVTAVGADITVTVTAREFGWNITADNEATVIDGLGATLSLSIEAVVSNGTTDWFNVTITPTIDYAYGAHQEGQYEWIAVGTDAATIDSIGAAYMTQAFDSLKQIHVQMTGLDIRDMEGPNAPYVMAGATTSTKTDYYYDYPNDNRTALADDWCTTVPVASSNMLFSGGPLANLGSEYFNDFTNAFYTLEQYVTNDTGHSNSILSLPCWDKNTYSTNATHGYAVVSVYKDINGTIGFLIWGINAQDTYYATKWFWSYPAGMLSEEDTVVYSGIHYLQAMNEGITDIVLRIYYPPDDPIHPTVDVIELLGTISEKPQHDCPAPSLSALP